MSNILNNDKYLISNSASISNIKNSFNKFISDLKDSSIENLIVNPLMQHKMATSTSPYDWDLEKGIGAGQKLEIINEGFYPQIWFYNPANVSQSLSQNVTLKLQPDTEYTLSVEIFSDAAFTFQILTTEDVNGVEKLIDLKNNNAKTNILENTFVPSPDSSLYTDHFYFKTDTRNVFHSIIVRIVNNVGGGETPSEPNNKLTLKSINLFKGSIEFTEGVVRHYLLDNVKYSSESNSRGINGEEPTDKSWKLTNDGFNYRSILLEGDIEGTIDLSGKLDRSTFYSEHDYFGNHQLISFLDSVYKITYNMKLIGNDFITTDPKVDFDIESDSNYIGVWNTFTSYNVNDIVKHNNMYWKSLTGNSNINQDPNIYSEMWVNVPPVTKFYVPSNFPDIQKAFYNEHCSSLTSVNGDYINGRHAIPHITKSSRYTINYTSDPLKIIPSSISTHVMTDLDAKNLVRTFNVEHNPDGSHNYNGNTPVSFNIFNPASTYADFTFSLTKGVSAKLEMSKNNIGTIPSIFVNSSALISHNTAGEHIVNDGDGFQYKIKVTDDSNGNPTWKFIPVADVSLLQSIFNIFRQEHDKYGNHVLRDTVTGIFYKLVTDGSVFVKVRTVFEPMTSIDEMLNVFNVNHGWSFNAGRTEATLYHYFPNAAGTQWYAYNDTNGQFEPMTGKTKSGFYHSDMIAYTWDDHTVTPNTLNNVLFRNNRKIHKGINTQVHNFTIANEIISNGL